MSIVVRCVILKKCVESSVKKGIILETQRKKKG